MATLKTIQGLLVRKREELTVNKEKLEIAEITQAFVNRQAWAMPPKKGDENRAMVQQELSNLKRLIKVGTEFIEYLEELEKEKLAEE